MTFLRVGDVQPFNFDIMSSERDGPGDVEGNKTEQAFLLNDIVPNFSWQKLVFTVKDRQTKESKDLICDVNGSVEKGTLLLRF